MRSGKQGVQCKTGRTGDKELTCQKSEQITVNPEMGNSEVNKSKADKQATDSVKKSQPCFAQSVQYAGKCRVQIEKRANPGKDSNKASGQRTGKYKVP